MSVANLIAPLRATYDRGVTRSLGWRKQQLETLRQLLRENETAIFQALSNDLGKCETEAFATELGLLYAELRHTKRRLRSWIRGKRIWPGLHNMPATARLTPQPLGVVLIIAPWNYPLMLALGPLIGALAAGNCAVIKPSEMTPNVSALINRLVTQYFAPDVVTVVEGAVPETTALLEQPFDHIFFTGSEGVGKIVMRAASAHLTPVTLELGGKSPCILTPSADMATAARRIAWGKCLNAGQTCVAPDYILALPGTAEAFKTGFATEVRKACGDDPAQSSDYPRIVGRRHFDRLTGMIEADHVAFGGQSNRDDLYLAPTLLENLPEGSPALTEEIFGPILPIIEVPSLDAAIAHINARAKPLALYAFTTDKVEQDQIAAQTSSGSAVFNEVVMQFGTTSLPFGGVGASGMGVSHGKASFDTFSHMKPVMRKPNWGEVKLRYAPYKPAQLKLLRRFFGG